MASDLHSHREGSGFELSMTKKRVSFYNSEIIISIEMSDNFITNDDIVKIYIFIYIYIL